ncbi:MAG: isoprenyl transferase [Bacteroidetes bacterium]|nr:isoprenyl transferase [Bacteroidota bacterium]
MNSAPEINKGKLPRHIAIIMDGNGRWAEEKGHDRLFGHLNGVESVRNVVEGAAELGVEYLTLYAFSTENWGRPQYEVSGLMELLVDTIKKEVPTLNKNNISLSVIGDVSLLPANAAAELKEAINETSKNTGLSLILALSYSSRWEILEMVKKIAAKVKNESLLPENISEEDIESALCTSGIPDPELLIRTGGDYRISNFLLYQMAYTELVFSNVKWPDFRKKDLVEAIADFQSRQRRFGKTGQQINNNKSG